MAIYLGTGGADIYTGSQDNDFISGNGGNDTLDGGMGSDLVLGGAGDDLITNWGTGSDTLDGAGGDDVFLLYADPATVSVTGGAGADTFVVLDTGASGGGPITINDFTLGEDSFQLVNIGGTLGGPIASQTANGAFLTFTNGTTVQFAGVSLVDLLRDQGPLGLANETLGSDAADRIFGGAGSDVIFGGLGNDTIGGGSGDDLIFGGAGNDSINAEAGNDTIDGGDGNDILHGNKGNNLLLGGAGDDYITSGDQTSTLDGGLGDDHLVLRMKAGGDHIVTGGEGADHFDFLYFSNKVGEVTITDLELGTDRVTFDGVDAVDAYFAGDLGLSDSDLGAVLSYGVCEVLLEGVSVAQITEWYLAVPEVYVAA